MLLSGRSAIVSLIGWRQRLREDTMAMKRDLKKLSDRIYDIVIIGGGIYGACVAWDATLRGLSVAIIEKGDFGSGTSANTLKIIHGGLRYLQHADFRRMRQSIRERTTLMRIAPHLVHPLPVVIPTYGHWLRGKEFLVPALVINELMSFDCNQLGDKQKHIPRSRVVSKKEVLRLVPGIHEKGLTGGVIFHDAQVYNSERLLLSFLRSAAKAGANPANYVEATAFLRDGRRVAGVKVKDVLTGDRFSIRAKTVVNTCGPWVDHVLSYLNGYPTNSRPLLAKAINVVTRPLFQGCAVGIPSSRFLFIAPWRGCSLIGTAYSVYDGDPDHCTVTERNVHDFLNQINNAYPAARLTIGDVSFVHGGLLPSSGICRRTGEIQLSQHYRIRDHRKEGIDGLISVVGVKYTTARHVAEKVVDCVFESWGQKAPHSLSRVTPVWGGEIERFERFLEDKVKTQRCGLTAQTIQRLIYNYGSSYEDVLRYLDKPANGDRAYTDDLAVLRAEALHGIHEEMAQKLSDVVFRRTELGTAGHPGSEVLKICAKVLRAELGWNSSRAEEELQGINHVFKNSAMGWAGWHK